MKEHSQLLKPQQLITKEEILLIDKLITLLFVEKDLS